MFNRIRRCLIAPVFRVAVLLSVCLGVSTLAQAQTVVVRVDGASGSASPAGQGNGWGSNAYLYLQDGLAHAQSLIDNQQASDVELRVRGASGSGITYKPDQGSGHMSGTRTYSFDMRINVKVLGQYIGGTGGNADTRDFSLLSILDGDLDNDGDYSDNAYHVVTANNSSITETNCRIDGFTIKRGNGDTVGGGGIYIIGGSNIRVESTATEQRA